MSHCDDSNIDYNNNINQNSKYTNNACYNY